jgi:hypothetical protein
MKSFISLLLIMALSTFSVAQEDETPKSDFEVETTTIKSNQELPKILYVVPWKDVSGTTHQTQQKLSLHDFFGDLYEPLIPSKLNSSADINLNTADTESAKKDD